MVSKRIFSFTVFLLIYFSIQGIFVLGEEEFIKTDPNVYHTGLIMMNPEMDSQAVEGSRYLQIRNLPESRAKIAASHFNYDYLPPVNSQGSQGSCVAWAVGYYYKSYQENREANRTGSAARSNPDNICSPAYIYNLIHVKGDGGAYFSDAFRVINDLGIPSLTAMPYNHGDYTTWPGESDFAAAIPNRTETTGGEYYYLRLDSDTKLNQLKSMLDNGQLAVFGIYVYPNYDSISSYNNIYTIFDKSGSSRGGHAQTIVGYDDAIVTNDGVGAFRAVNSWGTGWGDSGFYWISYTAIKSGSGVSQGYAYWVDDKIGYSSDKKATFRLSHEYSRETTTWVDVDGVTKYFFDFTVRTSDREYNAFPSSNIVLDLNDLAGYLTPGEELRLYMSDYLSNSKAGTIASFSYADGTLGINPSSSDTPVAVGDGGQDHSAIVITDPNVPEISLNKTSLTFAVYAGGSDPTDRNFNISNTGVGSMNWTISENQSWLSASPGSGTDNGTALVSVNVNGLSAGSYSGNVTVNSNEAYNSPQTASITLNVYAAGSDSSPFGSFDTPVQGSTVSGSIPVTGWALDDIEVTKVEIKRDPHVNDPPAAIGGDGLVYVGEAVFVKGARPDVEQAYNTYPNNDRAGWGYMLLTYGLPLQGNGSFSLYAIAHDAGGHQATLGSCQITSDNNSRVKPFGTIDTPGQGASASGAAFINWGWVLTPMPNSVPTDGSTIQVFVDGVLMGNPVYNIYRSDIANNFPGYANSNGAVGYFVLDTTQYADGVHTIGWSAVDNAANADGMGSRYFVVDNSGGATASITKEKNTEVYFGHNQDFRSMKKKGSHLYLSELRSYPKNISGPVGLTKGFSRRHESKLIYPDENGKIQVTAKETNRLVLYLNGFANRYDQRNDASETYFGYQVVGDELRALPIGSSLDPKKGILYWMPGPGYLGDYEFIFIRNLSGIMDKLLVNIKICPKH